MAELLTGAPPIYDQHASYKTNFPKFFDWACSLEDPRKQIPEIGEQLGFGVRRHPLGFIAVYLSPQSQRPDSPFADMGITGIARANIYPGDVSVKEDIHSHGFDFEAGGVDGTLLNTRFFPDFHNPLSEGEGLIGYETRVGVWGDINHVEQVTGAVVRATDSTTYEVSPGDTYSLRPRNEFHRVHAADSGGVVTIFCKTTPYQGNAGMSLMLINPGDPPPPARY
jgi:hypothetical protein